MPLKDGFITHVLRPMDVQVAIAHRRYLNEKSTNYVNITFKTLLSISSISENAHNSNTSRCVE